MWLRREDLHLESSCCRRAPARARSRSLLRNVAARETLCRRSIVTAPSRPQRFFERIFAPALSELRLPVTAVLVDRQASYQPLKVVLHLELQNLLRARSTHVMIPARQSQVLRVAR